MFATLWRSLNRSSARTERAAPRASRPGPRRCRPRLETLEDRTVLNAGALETTFGTNGVVVSPPFTDGLHDVAESVAIQSDGSIVVAGTSQGSTSLDFSVARYTPDGSLDKNFGSGGHVLTDFLHGNDVARGVALQVLNGKTYIVAAGFAWNGSRDEFAVVRYSPDGSLDTSFGSGGKVMVGFTGDARANAVAVQTNGRIVLAGMNGSAGNAFLLARLTSTGSLDTTFNGTGKVATDMGGLADARSVVLQADGKIVVAGLCIQSTPADFALARYTPLGALDPMFGTGGKVLTDFAGDVDVASGVVVQADGKIVAGGRAKVGGQEVFALARYTPGGALDPMYGTGGKVTTSFNGGTCRANAITLQADGKIVAAGSQGPIPDGCEFALARFTTGGALDKTFGTGGLVATRLESGNNQSQALGVALQANGTIVAAGLYENFETGGTFHVALALYQGDPLLALPPPLRNVTPLLHLFSKPLPGSPQGRQQRRRVTLLNTSGEAITGPLWLVLDHLPRKVRLRHKAGVTTVQGTPGSPYVAVALPGGVLNPGQRVSIVLDFSNPRMRKIHYTPLVLEGGGVL